MFNQRHIQNGAVRQKTPSAEKKKKKKKRDAVIRHFYLMTEISPHVDGAHQHLGNIFVPHH